MFNIPSFESVLQKLSELWPITYSALDFGIFKTQEFFDNQEREQDKVIDRYLAPNLVRYHAIQVLNGLGHEVREDNDINLENVANNGIHIKYGSYNLRILKSNLMEIPVPGHSKTRQVFYHQGQINFPPDKNNNKDLMEINLLLLWSVEYPYSLSNLSLACPKAGGSTRESVLHHWHEKIPESFLYGSDIVKTQKGISEILDLDIPIRKISNKKAESIND